jgi:hypothetical protein
MAGSGSHRTVVGIYRPAGLRKAMPMRQDDLNEYVDREPFQSFRLHLSSGAFVDIRNPEMVRLTRSTLTLGLSIEEDRQRFMVIALIHIVWLEILIPAP